MIEYIILRPFRQTIFSLVVIIVASDGLSEKDLAEVFVEEAVDSEVHQAIQDQEQVIG